MCVYCNELYKNNLDYLKNIGYKYSNRILFKNKYFFIVPTVGSFIENYLLIIPNRHVCSMRDLNKEEIDNLEKIILHLESLYENSIFFEHGSLDSMNLGGSSIVHAHIHFLPISTNLYKYTSNLDYKISEKFSDITSLNGEYLYLRQNSLNYFCENSGTESQFYRKIIANDLNISDYWNWKIYPYVNNMEYTYDNFSIL